MEKSIYNFGIDFGTTNSAAVSMVGNNCIRYGETFGRPFPSVVAINKTDGSVITGIEAKDKRNQFGEDYEYFTSIKSIIDSDKTWYITGKEWNAEDITSEILKSLKNVIMERCNDNNIKKSGTISSVIAVPVNFSPSKKKHLRNAATKAGIQVKKFISEPTAAYCCHHEALKACNNVAVFDWGGGTLDITVLNVENGKVSELAADGMNFAGDDIDLKFAKKLHTILMKDKENPISFEDLDPISKR